MVVKRQVTPVPAWLRSDSQAAAAAKAELERARGADFRYTTSVGTQKPASDYRKGSIP